jgi:tetratricopeptide (TPR) repeat protein
MELDQLYKRLGKPSAERLAFLQQHPGLIAQRDDLLLEEITLLNNLGRYKEAMEKLDAHQFHPWEGGEGKVSGQYQLSRVELARQALRQQHFDEAIGLLMECLTYPPHLGEGKLYGAQENDFYYYLGCAYQGKGDKAQACKCWAKATEGPQEPAAAMYYNDANPEKIFFQGLALLKLAEAADSDQEREQLQGQANGRFYKLLNYGKQHLFEHQTMDYFAVSLPDLLIWDDSLDRKNELHCKRMIELGNPGLSESAALKNK